MDTSVLLAQLLDEERRPPAGLWDEALVSSRLIEYETWVRLNARGLGASHGDAARALLGRIAFCELTPGVLARALEPFPLAVRTLDALHLATIEFLRLHKLEVTLATYDDRQRAAAEQLQTAVYPL